MHTTLSARACTHMLGELRGHTASEKFLYEIEIKIFFQPTYSFYMTSVSHKVGAGRLAEAEYRFSYLCRKMKGTASL